MVGSLVEKNFASRQKRRINRPALFHLFWVGILRDIVSLVVLNREIWRVIGSLGFRMMPFRHRDECLKPIRPQDRNLGLKARLWPLWLWFESEVLRL